ncbi:MAG TPA: hypothetical protein VFB81_21715, partial [Myxococcales bacterium]|nr:hypothetical protein [Myxococcales bacterium]
MIPFASQALAPAPFPESAPRASPRSPGLALFQRSPFRLLRLSVHAPEEEAHWKASRILAQLRARLPLAEPDLVSWLPPGDELDTQAASQRMEEPLQRVVDQLFWFDLTGAAALEEALVRRDYAGLMKYLDEPAPLHVASPPGSQHEEEMSRAERAAFAHRVNQANLHLLLGFSRLHLGSAVFAGVPIMGPPPESREPSPLKWKAAHGLSTLRGAHQVLDERGTNEEDTWAELLTAGLIGWRTLLSDPRFGAYTGALLRATGLESQPGEHDEAISGAIRTALAEAVAGELKLALAEGGTHAVSRLAAVARGGAPEDAQWRLSFRSLHGLFKAELAEMDDLVADSTASLSSIELYLQRLERLLARWRA